MTPNLALVPELLRDGLQIRRRGSSSWQARADIAEVSELQALYRIQRERLFVDARRHRKRPLADPLKVAGAGSEYAAIGGSATGCVSVFTGSRGT